jgi:hypothetical protein
MRVCAPPKFKILVANLTGGGDPSRIGGNPVKQRMGFELQQMVLPDGTTRLNGPTRQAPVTSATDYTAAIAVRSVSFWDPTIVAPGPFYYLEEARLFTQYPVAAIDFGLGHGGGTGPINDVATELAAWVNASVEQVSAFAAANVVYFTSRRTDERFPIQATNDMIVILGGAAVFFEVLDSAGTVLNIAGRRRASFFVPKVVKSQSPPTIF